MMLQNSLKEIAGIGVAALQNGFPGQKSKKHRKIAFLFQKTILQDSHIKNKVLKNIGLIIYILLQASIKFSKSKKFDKSHRIETFRAS